MLTTEIVKKKISDNLWLVPMIGLAMATYVFATHIERQNTAMLFKQLNSITAIYGDGRAAIVADVDLTILWTNEATRWLSGYAADELIGQNAKVLVPPELWDKHYNSNIAKNITGDPHVIRDNVYCELVKKDGTRVPVRMRISESYSIRGPVITVTILPINEADTDGSISRL